MIQLQLYNDIIVANEQMAEILSSQVSENKSGLSSCNVFSFIQI